MPPEHNQQHSRRPHYHRGRRGPDRRGDRRPAPQHQDNASRDQLDIEQIMREIRARISERHGIDLTNQQIQELAARRLEAILDPRTIKPSLMDELRRASGQPSDLPAPEAETTFAFSESALYESSNGIVRLIRRLLNPLLKLFLNPQAISDALDAQARLHEAAAAREAQQRRQQAEWNALHFEILRRLVTDIARTEIESQQLATRVESLGAKVDFNERRVRGLEQAHLQSKPAVRSIETAPPAAFTSRDDIGAVETSSPDSSSDSARRRRRRRRGRKSGGGQMRDIGAGGIQGAGMVSQPEAEAANGEEFAEDDLGLEEAAGEMSPPENTTVDAPPDEPRLGASQPAAEPSTSSTENPAPPGTAERADWVPPE